MKEIAKSKELVAAQQGLSKAAQYATAIVIKEDKDLKTAAVALEKIKNYGDVVKAEKEKITKPANEVLKAARDFFNPIEKIWRDAEGIIRNKMGEYQTKKEIEARKQEVKIEKQFEAGKITSEKAAEKLEDVKPVNTVEAKETTLKFVTHREMEITDINLIPDEYWEVDMVKLRKAVIGAGLQVQGTKVVETKRPSF